MDENILSGNVLNNNLWDTMTDGALLNDAPQVLTDKPDYAPGETVTIVTTGFAEGSTIEFTIADDPNDPGDDGEADVYTPFSITDGGEGDLDGVANGQVVTTWVVPTDNNGTGSGIPDALNGTLNLTATGSDGQVATMTFTDAAGTASKSYAHWSDEPLPGDWNNNILNDNKSNYFEGEVIPHVFIYEGKNAAQLVKGQTYSFNVTYNYYQQNTDAGGFAYMTQYNLSRQPNVFNWATPASVATADGMFTNFGGMTDGNGAAPDGASFYTVDADIKNVSAVTYTGTGNKDGVVTITFEYTGGTGGNGTYAAIYYGLYVARPGEVPDQGAGKTNGANAGSGGSLQTTTDIRGSGAESIQLAPSAIIPGEISGVKFNDLNGNGVKDAGELGLAGWTIVLDKDSNSSNGNLRSVVTSDGTTDLDGNGVTDPVGFYYFSVTPDADKSTPTTNDPYYVYEVNQSGWTQTAPTPIPPGAYGPLTVSATTPTYLNQNFGNRQFSPSLNITKTNNSNSGWTDTDGSGDLSAGDIITYTYSVQNTGNVALTNITLSDNKIPGVSASTLTSGLSDTDSDTVADDLAVGATATGTATYTIKASDLGTSIVNIATAGSDQTGLDTDTNTVPVPTPELNVIKDYTYTDADGSGDVSVGDTILYSYTVENKGTANLTGVTLSDDKLGTLTLSDVAGDSVPFIAAGDSETATASYVVQASDLGTSIVNVATAGSDQTSPDTDTETVPVPTPELSIEKQILVGSAWVDADTALTAPTLLSDADGKIDYRFVIANTGTASLTNVTVSDPTLGLTNFSVDTLMTPGEEIIVDVNDSPLLQPEWKSSLQMNTASADSVQTDPVSNPAYYFGADPKIAINKVTTVNGQTGDGLQNVTLGSAVTWTYTVTNTGNIGLSSVTVTDNQGVIPALDATLSTGEEDGILNLNDTWVYTAAGTANVVGNYSNIGTASGSYTDSADHTGTATASDGSSYSTERGLAKTPGFWKQTQHFQYWPNVDGNATTDQNDSFSETFFGTDQPGGNFEYPVGITTWFQDTLIGALNAADKTGTGSTQLVNAYGNVSALGRSATAGLLNALSDEQNTNVKGDFINYIIDPGKLSATSVIGGNPAKLNAILSTLNKVDLDHNNRIGSSEVISAVRDALDPNAFNTGLFQDAAGVNSLATALDAMNNMAGG